MEVHCVRLLADEDIVCAARNGGIRDNHSIAYCLLGYLCAYYRYYYPIQFITAFLNDAANDDDIKNGTLLARLYGLKVVQPSFGYSRDQYSCEPESGIIAKGVSSIKFMSEDTGTILYDISKSLCKNRFTDVLLACKDTPINSRQLDILVKIDFFNGFGNQRELMWIIDVFDLFKQGEAKQIKMDRVAGSPFEPIIKKYSSSTTKSGKPAKSYTFKDLYRIMTECEDLILSKNMEDLSDVAKVRNFSEAMGYAGYVSGKEEDRRKLFVREVFPVKRKRDGKQFGYSILTQSIGSGKEARFTVFNRDYDPDPINKGDVIRCVSYTKDGEYFTLKSYKHLYEDGFEE